MNPREEGAKYGIECPDLRKRERSGDFGETVEELTPESEIAWAEYLRKINMARLAFYKIGQDK